MANEVPLEQQARRWGYSSLSNSRVSVLNEADESYTMGAEKQSGIRDIKDAEEKQFSENGKYNFYTYCVFLFIIDKPVFV